MGTIVSPNKILYLALEGLVVDLQPSLREGRGEGGANTAPTLISHAMKQEPVHSRKITTLYSSRKFEISPGDP